LEAKAVRPLPDVRSRVLEVEEVMEIATDEV
jgi:hypothetical protein